MDLKPAGFVPGSGQTGCDPPQGRPHAGRPSLMTVLASGAVLPLPVTCRERQSPLRLFLQRNSWACADAMAIRGLPRMSHRWTSTPNANCVSDTWCITRRQTDCHVCPRKPTRGCAGVLKARNNMLCRVFVLTAVLRFLNCAGPREDDSPPRLDKARPEKTAYAGFFLR